VYLANFRGQSPKFVPRLFPEGRMGAGFGGVLAVDPGSKLCASVRC
jgi:hypothetical protein